MATTVGSILGGAFGLLRERPGAVAIWCLVYIGATVAMTMFMGPVAQLQAVPGGDPQANLAALQAFLGQMMLLWLFLMLLFTVLYAAAQRAVLYPQDAAFAYLRFGMDELRLIGLALILVIAFFVLLFVLAFVLALFVGLLAMAAGPMAAMPLVIVLYIALLGLIVWLEVRLSLVFSLTILRGKIIIGESWRLTKGRFWTLFGAYFVLALILFLLALAIALVTTGSYWSELMQSGFDPEAVETAARRQMERQLSPDAMTIVGWVLNGLFGGLAIALFGGALATATRDLTGDVEGIAGTFA